MFYYTLTNSLDFSNVWCNCNCDKRNEHFILYVKFLSISWLITIFNAFIFINILVSDWLEIMSTFYFQNVVFSIFKLSTKGKQMKH